MNSANSIRSRAPARPFVTAASLLVAALAFALPATVAAGEQPHGFVFTADERDASLTRIDLASGERITVDVPIAPHNVQVSNDGRTVLATGAPADDHDHGDDGHGSGPGKLLVFTAEDFADGPRTTITVGDHPAHVVSDQAGRHAFVTNAGDDTVSVVDLEAGTEVDVIATGAYPHGLRLGPDGRELYVANVEDGSVSVIDVEARAESARIEVGETPVQVGFLPDGSQVYVSLRNENRVAVIDTGTREVIAYVDTGNWPIQVYAHPDGDRMYVANEGTEDEPDNRVMVIDVASRAVIATIEVGEGAHGLATSADGRFVFATGLFDDSLSVIDARTDAVIATHVVGGGPNGVTWAAAAGSDTSQSAMAHAAGMGECPMMGGSDSHNSMAQAGTMDCPMMGGGAQRSADTEPATDGDHDNHH